MYIAYMNPCPLIYCPRPVSRDMIRPLLAHAHRRIVSLMQACTYLMNGWNPVVDAHVEAGLWRGRLDALIVVALSETLNVETAWRNAMLAGDVVESDALFLGSLHESDLPETRMQEVAGLLSPGSPISEQLDELLRIDAFLKSRCPGIRVNAFFLGGDLIAPAFPETIGEDLFDTVFTAYIESRASTAGEGREVFVRHTDRHGMYALARRPLGIPARWASSFSLLAGE